MPLSQYICQNLLLTLMTLFENALDHMFDTIELWSLKSVFGITSQQADHLTLLHHRGLDLRKSSDRPRAVAQHDSLNKAEQRLRLKIASVRTPLAALAYASTDLICDTSGSRYWRGTR